MSAGVPLSEQDRIVVGRPLPFSIFTPDGKLLLAAGQVVESDRLRDMLIRNGQVRGGGGEGGGGAFAGRASRERREQAEEETAPPESPLDLLRKDYETNYDAHRLAISIAPNETDKAYTVQLLGAHAQTIIVTAPVRPDGSLVPVMTGQPWLCRTFQMTSAFRFSTLALKVAFEPFPHLHLKLQKQVEQRKVRGSPRAKVSVSGELHVPDAVACVLVDLSATGARVAIDASKVLERGAEVCLVTSLRVLGSRFNLSLNGTVVNTLGPIDTRHSQVAFYGIKFSSLGELDSLVLHGFVSAHLLVEFHSLWQMLSMASSTTNAEP
jgi:hypothetical protein